MEENENEKKARDMMIVKAVIARMSNIEMRAGENTEEDCYLYQLISAYRYGYEVPFTAAQTELNDWLTKKKAGKEPTDNAWSLYNDLCLKRR